MLRSMLFLAPLALIGCASPTSGDYLFEYGDITTDCPTSDDTGGTTDDSDPIGIKVSDDGATVTISGTDCPLDGNTFTCSDSSETDYNDSGMDAVVGISYSMTGTWKTSSSISGTSESAITCEGGDCETIGLSSCSSSGDFTATLQD